MAAEVVYDGTGELDVFPVGAGTGLISIDGDAVELEELLRPWVGARVKLTISVEPQLGKGARR